jgi:DNA-binding response OmpR family regulator
MKASSSKHQRESPRDAPAANDLHVLFVAEDELSDLAELYRLKLGLDGYRVTTLAAGELTAQQVRELDPDFVILEARRLSPRIGSAWARVRWACGAKSTPIVILSPKREEELSKVGIQLEPVDHLVNWSRIPSLSSGLTARPI